MLEITDDIKVKATIAYDGSQYYGFQKQKSTTNTIAEYIETALKSLNIDSTIVASGRTDAGVHATGQVIHFMLPSYWNDLEKLKVNLNRKLKTIKFKRITVVNNDFHARFSAKKRLYRYVFKSKNVSLFEQQYISYYSNFNQKLLQEALNKFIGVHDFNLFRKTGTETHTTIREVFKAKYIMRGKYHFIYFQANGFLRSQIRMMVESAMQCAREELNLKDLEIQLSGKKRFTSKLAPAEGLYLAHISY